MITVVGKAETVTTEEAAAEVENEATGEGTDLVTRCADQEC